MSAVPDVNLAAPTPSSQPESSALPVAAPPQPAWEAVPSDAAGGYVASCRTEIFAPLDLVWRVMAVELAAYPEWCSFIRRIEPVHEGAAAKQPQQQPRALEVGALLKLELAWNKGDKPFDGAERVVRLSPPVPASAPDEARTALFCYDYAGLPSRLGLIRAHRAQQLKQAAEPGTPVQYETFVHFTSLMARFAGVQRVTAGLQRQAAELKQRCEALAAQQEQQQGLAEASNADQPAA